MHKFYKNATEKEWILTKRWEKEVESFAIMTTVKLRVKEGENYEEKTEINPLRH